MLSNPTFGGGIGLDVHIRTKIVKWWSVSDLSLRIRNERGAAVVVVSFYWYGTLLTFMAILSILVVVHRGSSCAHWRPYHRDAGRDESRVVLDRR